MADKRTDDLLVRARVWSAIIGHCVLPPLSATSSPYNSITSGGTTTWPPRRFRTAATRRFRTGHEWRRYLQLVRRISGRSQRLRVHGWNSCSDAVRRRSKSGAL